VYYYTAVFTVIPSEKNSAIACLFSHYLVRNYVSLMCPSRTSRSLLFCAVTSDKTRLICSLMRHFYSSMLQCSPITVTILDQGYKKLILMLLRLHEQLSASHVTFATNDFLRVAPDLT